MPDTSAPPKTLGIRHIALKVSDLDAMEKFYVDVLGYEVEWRPDPDNLYLNLNAADNLALHREKGVAPKVGPLDHFGIMLKKAADVDAWAAHIKGRGCVLAKEPKTHRDGARSFYVDDPEGNTIQFIHHPPLSGS
jgi:catechol 2,3-dioxygenase-like lactoylglutathione lyase family enzyme